MIHHSLANGIHVIDAEYIKPGIASVYLVEHAGKLAVVETGTTPGVPRIMAAVAELGFNAADVDWVIPTHIHLDHAGGAGALMAACPKARLVVHPRGARHMIDPSLLIAGTIAVYGEEAFHKHYGEILPIDSARVIEAPDGFELDFNGRVLQFLDTPGHALHHFCVYDPLSKGVFSGDTFGMSYPQLRTAKTRVLIAPTTPTQFDPDAFIQSIDRIAALQPDWVYLTHFGEVAFSEASAMQLKTSVQSMAAIALSHQGSETIGSERVKAMAGEVLESMLDAIRGAQPLLPMSDYEQALRGDAVLNAQGLEVWLNRLERAV